MFLCLDFREIFNEFLINLCTFSDKIMLKLTAKNSYMNDSLHEISEVRVQRKFVDCKLVFRGGVVQCHAAMLQYANIWWVNFSNSDIDECGITIPDMTQVRLALSSSDIRSIVDFMKEICDKCLR